MDDVRTRTYCRNSRCRMKLKAPVVNQHHAFCTPGCYDSFHHKRCVVCEREVDPRRTLCRRAECRREYKRFPAVFALPRQSPTERQTDARSAHEMGGKTAPQSRSSLLFKGVDGRGWCWEIDEGEHRLLDRAGALAARVTERAGQWVLTWPRGAGFMAKPDLAAAKRLALSIALGSLPLDRDTAARHRRQNEKFWTEARWTCGADRGLVLLLSVKR